MGLGRENAQVAIENILLLGMVIVVVLAVVLIYLEIVRSAGRALFNSTMTVFNQTIEEVERWLRRM